MKNLSNNQALTQKVYKWLLKPTLRIHTLSPSYHAYNCHHSVEVQGGKWIVATTQLVLHATQNTINLPLGAWQPFDEGYKTPTVEGTQTPAMKEVIDWAFENCNVPVKEVKPGLDASELAIHLENEKVVPINVDQFNRAVKLSAHSYTVSAHSEFKPILVKHFDKDGKLVAFAIVSPLSPFRPSAYPPNRKGKRKPKANPDKITVK